MQGSPPATVSMPPAAQAIIFLIEIPRLFTNALQGPVSRLSTTRGTHYLDSVRLVSYTFST
jgi:hypothetical protein